MQSTESKDTRKSQEIREKQWKSPQITGSQEITTNHRRSTEMKKICGFPDTFVIPNHVNYGDLFGNMATPPVIKEIFEVLLK